MPVSTNAVTSDLTEDNVFAILQDIIENGNVKKLIHLGSYYDLRGIDHDGALMNLALTAPNLPRIVDIIVVYLMEKHGWQVTGEHIIASATSFNADRFEIFVNSLRFKGDVMVSTFMILLQTEGMEYYTKQIAQARFQSSRYGGGVPLSQLLPPEHKQAIKLAKKYEAQKYYGGLPALSNVYRFALEIFRPENMPATLIKPIKNEMKADEMIKQLMKSVEAFASDPSKVRQWAPEKQRQLRDLLFESGSTLHFSSDALRAVILATNDELPGKIEQMFENKSWLPLPCKNAADDDAITQTPLTELSPLFIFIHDALCFDIMALRDWLEQSNQNPVTRRPFTDHDVDRLQRHMRTLVRIARLIEAH